MKLHLGCGTEKLKGYLNCDISLEVNPDKVVDLEKKLPFKSNTIDEIIINHTLEHIINFIELMEEFNRICKKGALIKIRVPYFAYPGAFQDPTHKRFFTLKTFNYFEINNKLNFYSKVRFIIKEKKLCFFVTRPSKVIDKIINKIAPFYERFLSRIFPAEELQIELEATKKDLIKNFPEIKDKVEVVYPAIPEIKNLKKSKNEK
jgi:ubiquinone/menaquinone biosynthesis C-methylase UbiE